MFETIGSELLKINMILLPTATEGKSCGLFSSSRVSISQINNVTLSHLFLNYVLLYYG